MTPTNCYINRKRKITKKLQEHQKILKKIENTRTKNENDARFMPVLEEAKEKNRILRLVVEVIVLVG
jgi:hypothetical protein